MGAWCGVHLGVEADVLQVGRDSSFEQLRGVGNTVDHVARTGGLEKMAPPAPALLPAQGCQLTL